MKVILRTDITNVGRQGEVKVVAEGYARNYLVPRNMAFEATPANMKIWEKQKARFEKERAEIIAKAREVAERMEKVSLTVQVKVGDGKKMFGSVTAGDIVRLLKQNDFVIQKQDVLLKEPIKEVGVFTIEVRLHPEVTARPKLWVVADKESKATEEIAEAAAEETTDAEPA